MSFISREQPKPEIDLSKPSIEGLVHILRNKSLWPEGFEWNYQRACTCALGLARRVWPQYVSIFSLGLGSNKNEFGMDQHAFDRIFFDLAEIEPWHNEEILEYMAKKHKANGLVTPEKVAGALEFYLQTGGKRKIDWEMIAYPPSLRKSNDVYEMYGRVQYPEPTVIGVDMAMA